MNILNLDKITLQDHEVQLGGAKYKIPGTISLGVMFEIIENQKELENPDGLDVDKFKKSLKTIFDVFIIRQPDLDFEVFSKDLSLGQYSALVTYIIALFGNTEEKKTEELPSEE